MRGGRFKRQHIRIRISTERGWRHYANDLVARGGCVGRNARVGDILRLLFIDDWLAVFMLFDHDLHVHVALSKYLRKQLQGSAGYLRGGRSSGRICAGDRSKPNRRISRDFFAQLKETRRMDEVDEEKIIMPQNIEDTIESCVLQDVRG